MWTEGVQGLTPTPVRNKQRPSCEGVDTPPHLLSSETSPLPTCSLAPAQPGAWGPAERLPSPGGGRWPRGSTCCPAPRPRRPQVSSSLKRGKWRHQQPPRGWKGAEAPGDLWRKGSTGARALGLRVAERPAPPPLAPLVTPGSSQDREEDGTWVIHHTFANLATTFCCKRNLSKKCERHSWGGGCVASVDSEGEKGTVPGRPAGSAGGVPDP